MMIVTKVVNKNLFLQPFSENLWTAGSNSVPILSAAMGIFSRLATELEFPLLKGFVLPPHFQVRRGTCLVHLSKWFLL